MFDKLKFGLKLTSSLLIFFELNRLNPNWVAKKDYEQDSTSNRCNTDFELIRLNPTCEKRKLEWNRLLLIYLHSYLDRLNPNVVK